MSKPKSEAPEASKEIAAEQEEIQAPVTTEQAVEAIAEEVAEVINEAVEAEEKVVTAEEEELKDAELQVEETEELDTQKHKNRESTSEKTKKAQAERVAKGQPVQVPKRYLDPLRLRGKKYREVIKLVDKNTVYEAEEALELVQKLSLSKFDGTVELHVKIKLEKGKSDSIRGTVVLPSGTGKTKRVAIADDDTIEAISNGKLDFDVLLATPAQMPKLAKYAKVLGPKGLMPSPKAGTVSDDLDSIKAEIMGGRVEYRADKTGAIHMGIGKISFGTEKLLANYKAVMHMMVGHKLISVAVAPTMGPSVRLKLEK